MNRRNVLEGIGAVSILSLSGCLSTEDSGDPSGDDFTPENQTNDDSSENTTGEPTGDDTTDDTAENQKTSIEDSDFSIVQRMDGTEINVANASTENLTVTVDGIISASDSCKTAEVGSVAYSTDADELTINIRTTTREDAGERTCTQQIVELTYQTTVSLSGSLPNTIVVTHQNSTGATQVLSKRL